MIGASRRQSGPAPSDPFRLHQREARQAAWQRRLLNASFAALAVAAITLFLPVGVTGRALAVVAGAAAGAAWPLRSRERAALRSIREQTGLSYETALAVLARRGDGPEAGAADPYGLEQAVVERARGAVRAYRSEARPPWWLPALLVAAVLVVLPALGPLAGGSAARGGDPAASGGGPEPLPADGGSTLDPAPQPPAPGRAEAPPVEPSDGQRAEAPPVAEPPDGGAGEQAPLSRYLDSLRERPAQQGGAPGQSETETSAGEEPREPGGGNPQGEPGEGAEQQGGGPADAQGGERSGAAPDAPQDSPAEDAGAAAQAEEGGDGSDGQQQGSEAGADGGQAGGEEGAGDQLDAGGAEPSPGEGGDSSGTAAGVPGDTGDGSEGSDSAGLGGGSDATVEGFEPSGVAGDTELLPGVLREGPETVAGSVRLPGRDEVELPPGTSYAPYQGAAEEALSEGDLPLDYQEIIRRYFR